MDNVVISVEGTQRYQGMDASTIRIVTDGTMRTEGETIVLSYNEPDDSGLEGTNTIIRVDPGHVTLSREGSLNSVMEFEKGKHNLSLYEGDLGAMTLGVNTRRIQNHLGPDGGFLEVSFGIEIGEMIRGLNTFRIDVKKQKTAEYN